ncbi:MAG: hypothetical protein EZS28_014783 [Streblomastix strix]|uniref:Guanylate cyclase domain-containing protein n=1 Tax=Streblomastix strix TaxID=222440 RepID=A0A5J4W4X1_9EUKA|nr:MAG: hypothetical protein EZS28_014783 [Streblomastix strix]
MVSIVFEHGGILDKFIDQALMAIWGGNILGADEDDDNKDQDGKQDSNSKDKDQQSLKDSDQQLTGSNNISDSKSQKKKKVKGPIDITTAAVTAAVECRDAIEAWNDERETKHGLERVRMVVGLNTGKTVAGFLGAHSRMEYTMIGDTVNKASRLCYSANPGQILISEETMKLIESNSQVFTSQIEREETEMQERQKERKKDKDKEKEKEKEKDSKQIELITREVEPRKLKGIGDHVRVFEVWIKGKPPRKMYTDYHNNAISPILPSNGLSLEAQLEKEKEMLKEKEQLKEKDQAKDKDKEKDQYQGLQINTEYLQSLDQQTDPNQLPKPKSKQQMFLQQLYEQQLKQQEEMAHEKLNQPRSLSQQSATSPQLLSNSPMGSQQLDDQQLLDQLQSSSGTPNQSKKPPPPMKRWQSMVQKPVIQSTQQYFQTPPSSQMIQTTQLLVLNPSNEALAQINEESTFRSDFSLNKGSNSTPLKQETPIQSISPPASNTLKSQITYGQNGEQFIEEWLYVWFTDTTTGKKKKKKKKKKRRVSNLSFTSNMNSNKHVVISLI